MMRANAFKKLVGAAMVAVVLSAGSASAQIAMSAGLNGHSMVSFLGGMTIEARHPMLGSVVEDVNDERLGGGFNAFFDVTYAELGIGMTFTTADVMDLPNATMNQSFLNLSLLGKYPLQSGSNVALYPMLGIEYMVALSGEINYGSQTIKMDGTNGIPDAADYSQFWLKFGFGADFNVTDAIFIRANLLYGLGFANKYWKNAVKEAEELLTAILPSGSTVDVNADSNHGVQLKLGVGYRF